MDIRSIYDSRFQWINFKVHRHKLSLQSTTELDRAIADTQEEIDTIVERNRRLIRE